MQKLQRKTKRDHIGLLAEISEIVRDTKHPQDALTAIVELVATRLEADVCSVYVLDDKSNELVLKATVGLRQSESIDKIRMKPGEGLTGSVFEERKPLYVLNPENHPKYKFFDGTGEEKLKTFLGVPLVYHSNVLGVLVVQTVKRSSVTDADIPILTTVASQIAATIAFTGLLRTEVATALQAEKRPKYAHALGSRQRKHADRTSVIRGFAVSAGIGEGAAHYLGHGVRFDQVHQEVMQTQDIQSQIQRLKSAFTRSEQEILAVTEGIRPGEDKAILEAQLMIVRDKALTNKIEKQIQAGYCAEYALKMVVMEYMELFSSMDDPYLKERAFDIEDIGRRILSKLFGVEGHGKKKFRKDTVVIAADISPVDFVSLRQEHLKGIVLSRGGKTSHAAIMARSFEIPMVIGATEVFETIKENDHIIVDGTSGLVLDNPPEVIRQEYDRLKKEHARETKKLEAIRCLPAITQDGYEIKLGANIGLLSDLILVDRYGADHVGLYRTEFIFLTRKSFPSEEDQESLYKRIVEAAQGKPLTIRTLDVGGDKLLSYLDYPKEQNPSLGWRSVRLCLELDEILRTQFRAILKASVAGTMGILFPMITSVSEVRSVLAILAEEKMNLRSAGVPFDENIPIGVMVEVPAAVRILDHLLHYVDFVSIGTNDLVQYTLAVDRNNEKVAKMYSPLHPAVLSSIQDVVLTCKRHNKRVSICGEAASNPMCAYLFMAMGTDHLSMNAASIPHIKALIRNTSLASAKKTLRIIMAMEDTTDIMAFLKENHPNLAID